MNKKHNYTRADYLSDCANPEMPHIKDPERFRQFYEELGRDPVQLRQQVNAKRIAFIKPEGNIIELGCHAGFNSILWAMQGFNCTGVDIAETLINEANRRRSGLPVDVGERLRFIRADILEMDPEEIGRFDTVVLTETLEHVIDPLPILKKAADFMAPGGKIYISAPSIRVGTYSHVRGISEAYLRELAEVVGLSLDFIPDLDFVDFSNTQAVGIAL